MLSLDIKITSKLKKKQILWLSFFVILTASIILFDSQNFSQPAKLKGGFIEVGFYRNENNDGPVVRIYSVNVKEPDIAKYKDYGDAMPYTLHGNTKVYFFNEKNEVPDKLQFDFPHFDTVQYKPIKIYERNGANIVTLKDY